MDNKLKNHMCYYKDVDVHSKKKRYDYPLCEYGDLFFLSGNLQHFLQREKLCEIMTYPLCKFKFKSKLVFLISFFFFKEKQRIMTEVKLTVVMKVNIIEREPRLNKKSVKELASFTKNS